MAPGAILLADDEEAFRESTSRLLCRDGFDCCCARDADETIETLRHRQFDVLVSDIRMPANTDLRVVAEAHKLDPRLPVILVTGYPSTDTAIRGIDMAVEAYLAKPLDYDDLVRHIRDAVKRSRARRRISSVIERLRLVASDLEAGECQTVSCASRGLNPDWAPIRTLTSCLSDLLVTLNTTGQDGRALSLCQLLDCPQQPSHRLAILDAIEVLQKTKENFKSKQLAELRARLEEVVDCR